MSICFPLLLDKKDLLDCDTVMIIHHTDCGGQAVVRRYDELMSKLFSHFSRASSWTSRFLGKTSWYSSYLLPKSIRRKLTDKVLFPIYDLNQSVLDDMKALRKSSVVNRSTSIHGYIYDTETGKLETVAQDTA